MRIIYKDSDGVKVIIPSPNYKGTLEELAKKRVPEGLTYKIVSDDSIPADRYFRNAWDMKSGKVVTDITKAKELKKEILRQERKPLLEALDVEVMKNIKDPVKIDEIESQKQKLRDITSDIDKIKTVDELKQFKIEV
jgi:hypothetical protein